MELKPQAFVSLSNFRCCKCCSNLEINFQIRVLSVVISLLFWVEGARLNIRTRQKDLGMQCCRYRPEFQNHYHLPLHQVIVNYSYTGKKLIPFCV